jgi:hypothetical protein
VDGQAVGAHPGPGERGAAAEPADPLAQPDTTAGGSDAGETSGEPATTPPSGRPSSRRKPSDLSLADLLAEALVAYETGRREDEEQFQATDLATPDWSPADSGRAAPSDPPATQEQSFPQDQLLPQHQAAQDQAAPQVQSGNGQRFGLGRPSFADQPFVPGHLLGSGQRFGAEPSFGQPAPVSAVPVADQPTSLSAANLSAVPPPPGLPSPVTEEETTGPIVPVGAASDEETTGPIRRVQTDGVGGWTLPGT